MAYNYQPKKTLADNKLAFYGMDIVLVDSATITDLDTYKGIKAPVRLENTPQSVIDVATATVYLTVGTVEPKINQWLRINGENWNIVWVEPVELTNVTIMRTVFVSKGG